jgi:sulfite exporter TauE/SafE
MELWTAFLLGLIGSAHCAGMCGPLALALPATGNRFAQFFIGRLLYNLGRVVTYAALGAVFGLAGQTFAFAGLQRWVSIVAGIVILAGLAAPRFFSGATAAGAVHRLKSFFGMALRRRTPGSLFVLGLLNGLLPCGLVYVACAATTANDTVLRGIEYMIAFGLGTVPMMLGISLTGQKLQLALRFKLQRLIPAGLVVVGALLLLRGMALGIPHLSPRLSESPGATHSCCHNQ